MGICGRRLVLVGAMSGLPLIASCGDQGPDRPAGEVAVHLAEAVDLYSGAGWTGEVRIGDVQIDGDRVTDLHALGSGSSFHVAMEGNQLVCTMPCGFGSTPGNYRFTVSALGYQPAQMEVDVPVGRGAGNRLSPQVVRPALEPRETPLKDIEVIPSDSLS